MQHKMVAPVIDNLLLRFDRSFLNPAVPSEPLKQAIEPLFSALKILKPSEKNDEAKQLWLRIPRGSIEDYSTYEDMLEWGEVKDEKEYEQRWRQDYPEEYCWYSLIVTEGFNKDGSIRFRGMSLGNCPIVNAEMDSNQLIECSYSDESAIELCSLIIPAVAESMQLLQEGTYNETIAALLPYKFRTGVVKRSVISVYRPELREAVYDGISAETINQFRNYLAEGQNNQKSIGRLNSMTANDFFHACSLGYQACGFDISGKTESEQYLIFGDGRDDGLTGNGHCIEKEIGIDFNSPTAWEQWYFNRSIKGGHPWEVLMGGNSTHLDLFVCHERNQLDWKIKLGEITKEETETYPHGFYFEIAGKHRAAEAIHFYIALKSAGLPVLLRDADEILARFDETDYIGIVPHHVFPCYCEGMFPAFYGRIIDFIHVYDEDIEKYGNQIEWLPLPIAELRKDGSR